MRQPAILTPSEIEILRQGEEDPDVVSDYFFRPPGEEHGWLFDYNFTPEGAWQKSVHVAAQRDITVIGGFGTGKTSGVGVSACVWALEVRDFKFLNAAPKAWQAKLMYDYIITISRNTRFEDLIWEKPRKPHPAIILRYQIGKVVYESSLEFMSADKDATGILSWEGDWLHVDEAGLLDNLEEVIINTGSRLRGSIKGRARLGRFSMASNSWDNFYLWYYFDHAVAEPENFLSLVVSSRANKNITEEQLARMVARIPVDERERFINGGRPEGKGLYFAREEIYACEDKWIGPFVMEEVRKRTPGFVMEKLHGAGIVDFRIPRSKNHMYMLFGDPGVSAAPQRNSPVLQVWDVTTFPRTPARLVAFWWGNGNGKIGPWINQMFKLIRIFLPVYCGIDSTGPQKNMNFLINEHVFKEKFRKKRTKEENQNKALILEEEQEEIGYLSPLGLVKGVGGLDFSGAMKNTYLQAARLLIEANLFSWPYEITGLRSQLSNYEPEEDKKIAQDIVATIAMAAHAIRTWFHVDPQTLLAEANAKADDSPVSDRRLPAASRNRRSGRARISEPVKV